MTGRGPRRRRPPALLRRLLAACLPPGRVRDGLLGDLEELYAERHGRRGRVAADLWYVRQLLGAAARYLPQRAGAGGRVGRGGGSGRPWEGLVPDAWHTGARELRLAARGLRRSPGFTGTAVLTLAVGIGSVTAMFTVLEQVVLRPLPVDDQDRLVVAWNHHHVRQMPHFPVVGDVYRIVEDEATAFAAMAGVEWGNPTEVLLEGPDGAGDVVRQAKVRGDFFGVLGVDPVVGRTLRPEDDVAGAEPVVVVSQGLWQDRFGGDPDLVGRALQIGRVGVRVVGVLPRDFGFPGDADVWIPLRALHPGWQGAGPPPEEMDLVARLAPGVTGEEAAAELARIYREHPELATGYEGVEPVVRPLVDVVLGDLRPTLFLLLGGAGLVLMVACVNVGSLVTARAAARKTTAAVRRALGAHRWQVARQAWIEGLLLGAAGGVGGVALGWLTVRLVVGRAPPGLPRMGEVPSPGATTLLFAAGLTAAVTAALAVLPVVWAGRADPAGALRGGRQGAGPTAGGFRSRGTLTIAGQTALAVWAAATAVLLFRGLVHLQRLDPGLRAEGVTLVELDHPYALFQAPEDLPDRMGRVTEGLEARPWIEAVAPSFLRPMAAAGGVAILGRPEGQSPEEAARANPYLNVEVVGPGYFGLLEMDLERGRGFEPGDRAGAPPVAVVNRRAAEALWPDEDPLGRRLMGFQDRWLTVVGVSEDTRYQSLEELLPTLYLPLAQGGIFPPRYLLVRTAGAGPVLPAVRQVLEEIDPAVRARAASSLRARLEEPLARPRFSVLVLGVLAGAVLLLATVGVYGVMAAHVGARWWEMGVRMALGAAPRRVRGMIVGQGTRRAAAGAALGSGAYLLGAPVVERLLSGVAATDPWSLAAAVALVLSAAALASWIPARRAAGLDPARTLRPE